MKVFDFASDSPTEGENLQYFHFASTTHEPMHRRREAVFDWREGVVLNVVSDRRPAGGV